MRRREMAGPGHVGARITRTPGQREKRAGELGRLLAHYEWRQSWGQPHNNDYIQRFSRGHARSCHGDAIRQPSGAESRSYTENAVSGAFSCQRVTDENANSSATPLDHALTTPVNVSQSHLLPPAGIEPA